MRICIIGVGAIGGLLAAKLANAGQEVSVVARGAHLAAIKSDGLRLIQEGDEILVHPAASDCLADLGEQDLLVLSMKAHQVSGVMDDLRAAIGPRTAVLTAQNGIPWWYFFKHGGPHEGTRLESVDPSGVIAKNLPIDRVLATVVYPAAEIERPGIIRHIEGNRFSLAEIDGQKTDRVQAVSEAFTGAGFKSPVVSDVRAEIWTKLWGNLSFNPISALTHATLEEICKFSPTRSLAADMMREAQAVGEALGVHFRISFEKRIAGAEAVGAHKTSMLQDVENGRKTEISALLGSVIELGHLTGVATPSLIAVCAIVKLLDATLDRQKGRLVIEPA